MKRFKNILAIYDLAIGSDETLQRAITLARQNEAHLTVLHIVEPKQETMDLLFERRKLMNRLFDNMPVDKNQFNVLVKYGERVHEILDCVSNNSIDLIVAPTERNSGFETLVGTDTTSELMRATDTPIWVVRPGGNQFYCKVVAAVNAGKDHALECQANKRILQMASSLAKRENAVLDVLYVWNFGVSDEQRLTSEMHEDARLELFQLYRYTALEEVVNVTKHVLGEPFNATPVVRQGDVEDCILDYVSETSADLLVTEGSAGSPIMNALLGNRSLRILNQANCSVLVSRPRDYLDEWTHKMKSSDTYSYSNQKVDA
ncbi:hypothetical protein MTBPR1_210015 [Candidatus Terasakiella magnetica]|uniref:UspA domain-containing protein n=1 Tax=Candidatus Terasakiella magnetica TaxID=1867952 RepID=A0A1C3RGZ3_9PROT|nr:universal stress protein [Candidatus Terasakiella magnetica]SCA56563.1 hypothetical protein MTBPR1_210015 [Candidatus Terasakiella magnetica]